jgi:gliding motility-associated-like protein
MKRYILIIFQLLTFVTFSQNWGKNTESAFVNEAMDIEVDASGNSYVCGYITGETAFDVTVVEPQALGNGDIYVAKYNSSGQLTWVRRYGGSFSDRAYDLAIDSDQNIYITGQYYGTVNFGTYILNSTANSKDIFLLKMDPSGEVLWARSEGGSGSENASGITTDNLNNLILTGQYTGSSSIGGLSLSSTFDPNLNAPAADLFISKYTSNGDPIWVLNGQAKYEDRGLAVHTDFNNNIYMTGQFSDTLVFSSQTIYNIGYNVGFLAKINPQGSLQWLRTIRAGMVLAYDLEVDNQGDIVVVGDFIGNLQYTTPSGINTITNPYSKQIFALKTNSNGNYIWGTSLGSDNTLSARSISTDVARDIYITGFFSCDWTEMQTNQGIFNSVGFKDAYLWKVSNSGLTTYVKQFGGKRDDEGHGVAIANGISPIICGSYTENLNIPGGLVPYTTANNHFNLRNNIVNEPTHYYLWGDESRNSFLIKAIGSFTPAYDYFYLQPADSLYGFISPNLDTINLCSNSSLLYDPQTYSNYGPGYNYLWSSGQTTRVIPVSAGGEYSVQVERWDGCSSGTDTTFVIIHPLPTLPTLHDEFGASYNTTNSGLYQAYSFCFPDTLSVWFSNLCEDCSISIQGPNANYQDTLSHEYFNAGNFYVTVQDSFCTSEARFTIDFDYVLPYDIEPYLIAYQDSDFNDTITICSNTKAKFHVYDYLENPDTTINLFPTDPIADYEWTISGAGSTTNVSGDSLKLEFLAGATGWYTITYWGAFGYENLCGLDTTVYVLSKTIYIEVLPTPVGSTSIAGDNLICPNGSVYLYLTNGTLYDLNWVGSGINWTSSNGDSVQVTAAGTYSYQGYLTDTSTQCSVYYQTSFLLQEKTPPSIYANPSDGIICPYDSVLMAIDDIYLSYSWNGPSGSNLSTSNSHLDGDQGMYYVIVEDDEGCMLTSPPFEIKEFTTPYIIAEPSTFLCEGDIITLSTVIIGSGTQYWTSPINSSQPSILVSEPGWYYCEISQCGITILDSVQIISGVFEGTLSASDTILCYGETAVLIANSGMADYNWTTGEMGAPYITVSEEGFYSAQLTNQYGCEASTPQIWIEYIENSEPPQINGTSVCFGESVVIENPSNIETLWFSQDSTYLTTGISYSLYNLTESSVILAAYENPECPTLYSSVNISVIDTIPAYQIQGDSILCYNQTGMYELAVNNGESINWMLNGQLYSQDSQIQVSSSDLLANSTFYAEVFNSCFSETLSFEVVLLPQTELNYAVNELILCPDSEQQLVVSGPYSNATWLTEFGSIITDTLELYYPMNGYIYVHAFDNNGCQTTTDSILLISNYYSTIISYNPSSTCEGDSVSLTINGEFTIVHWNTPSGEFIANELDLTLDSFSDGWYTLTVTDSLGCVLSDSIELIYGEYPIYSFPEDTTICSNEFLGGAISMENLNLIWTEFGPADSVSFSYSGQYYFTVVGNNGCFVSDSVNVEVIDCGDELPNVITANNDGVNDFFIIDEAELFPNNRLIIINRWGNTVFDETSYKNNWNADKVVPGTYFYTFYYDTYDSKSRIYNGFVTVVK